MRTYLYARWLNNPADSPAEFYSELDSNRWETRKVEVFRDGRMGYATAGKSTRDTNLAIVQIPSLEEINKQSEFEARAITADEFEAAWKRAAG